MVHKLAQNGEPHEPQGDLAYVEKYLFGYCATQAGQITHVNLPSFNAINKKTFFFLKACSVTYL